MDKEDEMYWSNWTKSGTHDRRRGKHDLHENILISFWVNMWTVEVVKRNVYAIAISAKTQYKTSRIWISLTCRYAIPFGQDIKVGICDQPIEKAKSVSLEPFPDLDKLKYEYKGK